MAYAKTNGPPLSFATGGGRIFYTALSSITHSDGFAILFAFDAEIDFTNMREDAKIELYLALDGKKNDMPEGLWTKRRKKMAFEGLCPSPWYRRQSQL